MTGTTMGWSCVRTIFFSSGIWFLFRYGSSSSSSSRRRGRGRGSDVQWGNDLGLRCGWICQDGYSGHGGICARGIGGWRKRNRGHG